MRDYLLKNHVYYIFLRKLLVIISKKKNKTSNFLANLPSDSPSSTQMLAKKLTLRNCLSFMPNVDENETILN